MTASPDIERSTPRAADSSEFSDSVLALLRCPVTGSKLTRQGDELVSEIGALRYPIRGGIAVLLASEAILPDECESLEAFRERFVKDD